MSDYEKILDSHRLVHGCYKIVAHLNYATCEFSTDNLTEFRRRLKTLKKSGWAITAFMKRDSEYIKIDLK